MVNSVILLECGLGAGWRFQCSRFDWSAIDHVRKVNRSLCAQAASTKLAWSEKRGFDSFMVHWRAYTVKLKCSYQFLFVGWHRGTSFKPVSWSLNVLWHAFPSMPRTRPVYGRPLIWLWTKCIVCNLCKGNHLLSDNSWTVCFSHWSDVSIEIRFVSFGKTQQWWTLVPRKSCSGQFHWRNLTEREK